MLFGVILDFCIIWVSVKLFVMFWFLYAQIESISLIDLTLLKYIWIIIFIFSINIILADVAAAKSLQSCPTLCDPIDGSPPGSSVPGILQARIPEWVAVSFSKISFLALIKFIPKKLIYFVTVNTSLWRAFFFTVANLYLCDWFYRNLSFPVIFQTFINTNNLSEESKFLWR